MNEIIANATREQLYPVHKEVKSVKVAKVNAPKFRILGITDERSACDCCGKTGLKRVVALEEMSTLKVWFYGTTCAANTMKTSVKSVKTGIELAQLLEKCDEKGWSLQQAQAYVYNRIGYPMQIKDGVLEIHTENGVILWAAA